MRKTIHQTINNQFDWIEQDENECRTLTKTKERQMAAKAELFIAIGQYFKSSKWGFGTECARFRGISQGMIRQCYLLDAITSAEYECLLNMLG